MAGDLHVLVDVDVAAVAGLEVDGVEPELSGPRRAPERGDELLGVDGRVVVHVDAERVAVLLDLGRLAAGADVDALLDERVGDLRAGELLLAGEQPPLALDQRHLGAERAVGLRQLGAEHAAAEDHDRVRDLLGGGGLAVGPRLGLAQALDRRERGARAAGEDHRLARLELVVADVDALLAVEDTEAAVQLDPAVLEPRQHAGVVEVVDDLVAAVEHGLDVELAGHRLGRAGDAVDLAQDLLRAQQRLGGHARVERALAADDVVLDQRDLEPRVGQPPRRHLTGGPAADHHHVEAVHASPRFVSAN